MQLEFVCDMELKWNNELLTGEQFILVRPYGGEEGSGWGEGEGTVSGPRLQGKMRWYNHPHRRSDGTMLPNASGIIVTPDQAIILVTIQGRTAFEGDVGRQLLSVLFESQAESYRWLNTTLCVLEGVVIDNPLRMRARVYACRGDLVAFN